MEYQDFDLIFEQTGDNNFRVRGSASSITGFGLEFTLPFSRQELKLYLLQMGQVRSGIRRIESEQIRAAREFGGKLYQTVFQEQLEKKLRSSIASARQRKQGLRLRLDLSQAPALADLPWELLFNPASNRFLALSVDTPVVRHLTFPDAEPTPALTIHGPIQMLAVIASPNDLPALNVRKELRNLRKALQPLIEQGRIELDVLAPPTLPSLTRALREKDYHILHFIGHGGFDESAQDGLLVMEDERGYSRRVGSQTLGTLLHDEKALRLAILNACEGGRASVEDPFAGVAQSLVQQGIPAVVAMQFPITDEAAITFAGEFYSSLASGSAVDSALAEARKAMLAKRDTDIEWGTPVLYMRVDDGRLFTPAPEIPLAVQPTASEPAKPTEDNPPKPVEADENQKIDKLQPLQEHLRLQSPVEKLEGAPPQASEQPPEPLEISLRPQAQEAAGGHRISLREFPRWLMVAVPALIFLLVLLGIRLQMGGEKSPPAQTATVSLGAGEALFTLAAISTETPATPTPTTQAVATTEPAPAVMPTQPPSPTPTPILAGMLIYGTGSGIYRTSLGGQPEKLLDWNNLERALRFFSVNPQSGDILYSYTIQREVFDFSLNQVNLLKADGSQDIQLFQRTGNAAWSSDGKRIVFYAYDPDGIGCCTFISGANGENPQKLSKYGNETLAWNHAQTLLVTSDSYSLFTLDMSGKRTALTGDMAKSQQYLWRPAWSPDDQNLVLICSESAPYRADLCTLSKDGSRLVKIIDTPNQNEWLPEWVSQDKILYVVQDENQPQAGAEIWMFEFSTRQSTLLFTAPNQEKIIDFSWLPD